MTETDEEGTLRVLIEEKHHTFKYDLTLQVRRGTGWIIPEKTPGLTVHWWSDYMWASRRKARKMMRRYRLYEDYDPTVTAVYE